MYFRSPRYAQYTSGLVRYGHFDLGSSCCVDSEMKGQGEDHQDTHCMLVCPTAPHIPVPCIPGKAKGGGGGGLLGTHRQDEWLRGGMGVLSCPPLLANLPPTIQPWRGRRN